MHVTAPRCTGRGTHRLATARADAPTTDTNRRRRAGTSGPERVCEEVRSGARIHALLDVHKTNKVADAIQQVNAAPDGVGDPDS